MEKILENLKSKEFYKKNWHRFLVAPILFFGIFFSSLLYLVTAGFYIIYFPSLLVGFIFSIMFAKNYNKYYFFGLVFILLLQIITVNINTKKYEHFLPDKYTIGKYSQEEYGDKYYEINTSCFGLKRHYYDTTKCVGELGNCFVETFSKKNNQSLSKEDFSCRDYDKVLKEKEKNFYPRNSSTK